MVMTPQAGGKLICTDPRRECSETYAVAARPCQDLRREALARYYPRMLCSEWPCHSMASCRVPSSVRHVLPSAYDRLPLNALRVFEAVATRLNFTEAAEALHVTPAAVSQQIKSLEEYLQTPLFRRDGRRVYLTPEGAQLLPGVRQGLDELETTLQRLRQERQTGTINVSMLAS